MEENVFKRTPRPRDCLNKTIEKTKTITAPFWTRPQESIAFLFSLPAVLVGACELLRTCAYTFPL